MDRLIDIFMSIKTDVSDSVIVKLSFENHALRIKKYFSSLKNQ